MLQQSSRNAKYSLLPSPLGKKCVVEGGGKEGGAASTASVVIVVIVLSFIKTPKH